MLKDGTILAAAHGNKGVPYTNSTTDVYRVERGADGVCKWGAPFTLAPLHAGQGVTASPGRFVEDPGDETVRPSAVLRISGSSQTSTSCRRHYLRQHC
jgi:hypothetical protein